MTDDFRSLGRLNDFCMYQNRCGTYFGTPWRCRDFSKSLKIAANFLLSQKANSPHKFLFRAAVNAEDSTDAVSKCCLLSHSQTRTSLSARKHIRYDTTGVNDMVLHLFPGLPDKEPTLHRDWCGTTTLLIEFSQHKTNDFLEQLGRLETSEGPHKPVPSVFFIIFG